MKRPWVYLVACAAPVASLLDLETRPSVAAERGEATYSHGSHTDQKFAPYWNTSNSRRREIAILSGGYWYEDSGWVAWPRYFADRGHAVFSAGCRLNFDADWPAPRTDAISAIDWNRDNAAQFDLPPDRLVVLGSSDGGQIAKSLAIYAAGGSRVSEVAALSSVAPPYRARNDGNHDTGTNKQHKVRDNAAILARCFPNSTDISLHASCSGTWKDRRRQQCPRRRAPRHPRHAGKILARIEAHL